MVFSLVVFAGQILQDIKRKLRYGHTRKTRFRITDLALIGHDLDHTKYLHAIDLSMYRTGYSKQRTMMTKFVFASQCTVD